MNLSKNCLKCANYFSCKDSAKSIIYSCSRFSVMKASNKQEAQLLEDILQAPILSFNDRTSNLPVAVDTSDELDAFKMLKSVIKDNRIVSPDIKVPEGDFPEAPNFYTWCVSDKYLNQKPFIEQAIIGTRLFAEYCPDCTDMEWFLHTHKVTDSLIKFERRVALLEHGQCPHCHKTRLHFFKKHKLNAFVELALSAGQRSGKSALTAMLTSYIVHRAIKLERPNEVYGLLKATILQGTFVALTFAQAKDTLWDPFYGNLLDSPWFCVAEDTPICLSDSSTKPIQSILVGDIVETLEGPQEVINVFDNGIQECFEVCTEDGHLLQGTAKHQVRCLSDDGESLVWKNIADLTDRDYVVVSQDA